MPNQQGNGRNAAVSDENRQSWRPQDENITGRVRRGMGDEDERSFRDRDRDDDRFMQRDRERFGGHWEDRSSRWDRDEGYRSTERYGQGQSGYGAGRYEDDRSMRFQSRMGQQDRGYGQQDRGYGQYGQQDRGYGQQDRSFGYGYGQQYGQSYGAPGNTGFGVREFGGGGREIGREVGGGRESGYGYGRDDERMGSGGYLGQGGQQMGYGQGVMQTGSQQYGGRSVYGQDQQIGSQQYGGRNVYGQDQQIGRGVQGQGMYGEGGYNQGMYGQQGGMQSRYGSQGYQGYGQQGMHRGKGPLGYMRSDERIKETVCEALTDDDRIDATNIEITVKNGEVTLSGTVEDRQQKRLAEDSIENLSGVKDVQNQIRVVGEKKGSAKEQSQEPQTTQSEKRHRA